jgi:hypothetical protein
VADYKQSLNTVKALLDDPAAFKAGKPTFKNVAELDGFLRAKGFKLPAGNNTKFGPPDDPDARQMIYMGPNNVVVKVKTAGYEGGPRMGRPTLSIEVTDGKGSLWENTLFKVDAGGKIIAKNVIDVNQPVVKMSGDGEWGVQRANGKVEPIVKWEVIVGGKAPPFNRQEWADRGHLDLPPEFDKAGAAQIGQPPGPQLPPPPVPGGVPSGRLGWGSRVRSIAGNQAAMAALGVMLGELIQSLGDIGIRRKVQEKLGTTYAKYIEQAFARGEGVLVIVRIQEWDASNYNDQRARSLLAVYVESGPNQAAALANWRGQPRLLQGPAEGWRAYEQYAWIAP